VTLSDVSEELLEQARQCFGQARTDNCAQSHRGRCAPKEADSSSKTPPVGTRVCGPWDGWKNAKVWCVIGRFRGSPCFKHGCGTECTVLAPESEDDHKIIKGPLDLWRVVRADLSYAPVYHLGSSLVICIDGSEGRYVVEKYERDMKQISVRWIYLLRNKNTMICRWKSQEELIAIISEVLDTDIPKTTEERRQLKICQSSTQVTKFLLP